MAEAAAHDGGLGRARVTVAALVRTVCPSQVVTDEFTEATVEELAGLVAVLAPATRRGVLAVAVALEQAARVRCGRPFSALRVDEARELLARWSSGPLGTPLRLLRDLVVVASYEQPVLRQTVGYLPDPFIADTAAARLARWSDDIAAHADLLVTPAPLHPPVAGSPGQGSGRVRPGVRCQPPLSSAMSWS